jgi:hypothetical protein
MLVTPASRPTLVTAVESVAATCLVVVVEVVVVLVVCAGATAAESSVSAMVSSAPVRRLPFRI